MQEVLDAGCHPDAADYDKRTGLMLAVTHGHRDVVQLLLAAGANPNARDNLGGSALLEAVKSGREGIMSDLLAGGAWLQLSRQELAAALCEAVADDQPALLQRFIAAGADVNLADYDRRTPLHVAAADGKLALVRVLVVEGGADLGAVDRWGQTPVAEAQNAGAGAVEAYLRSDEARQAAYKARQVVAERAASGGRGGVGNDLASLQEMSPGLPGLG